MWCWGLPLPRCHCHWPPCAVHTHTRGQSVGEAAEADAEGGPSGQGLGAGGRSAQEHVPEPPHGEPWFRTTLAPKQQPPGDLKRVEPHAQMPCPQYRPWGPGRDVALRRAARSRAPVAVVRLPQRRCRGLQPPRSGTASLQGPGCSPDARPGSRPVARSSDAVSPFRRVGLTALTGAVVGSRWHPVAARGWTPVAVTSTGRGFTGI